MSSRSFFPSTTPLYQLLALFGGYRRSRPQPDTPPPAPSDHFAPHPPHPPGSALVSVPPLAPPGSPPFRLDHRDAPNATQNGAAPRPGACRTRKSSRPEDTPRTPPLARLESLRATRRPRRVADPFCHHCGLATRLRRPLRPVRFRDGEQVSGRGLDLSARALERQVSLDVRDLALALRYAYTPSGLSRPTEWRPARGPYPRPLRGGRRTVALRDPTWGVSCTSPTSYDPVSAVARTSRSHGGRRGARGDG